MSRLINLDIHDSGGAPQFRHPSKPGTVTVKAVSAATGRTLPSCRGLGVAGDSIEEVERLIREAIPLHIESLRANGDPVPPPSTVATTVVPAPAA